MLIRSVKVERLERMPRRAAVETLLSRFGNQEGFMLLESSWPDMPGSRHCSYALLAPVLAICHADGMETSRVAGAAPITAPRPLECLDGWLLPRLDESWPSGLPVVPLVGGYFSYELGSLFERVKAAREDAYGVPLYALYLYSRIIVFPSDPSSSAELYSIDYEEAEPLWDAGDLRDLHGVTSTGGHTEVEGGEAGIARELEAHSTFTRSRYETAVEAVREMIRAGAVYQVNLSQQFRLPLEEDAASFYRRLRRINPSHYGGFIRCGSGLRGSPFSIASSSPELFLEGLHGELRTSPIKGTRPRGRDAKEDAALRRQLSESAKDRSELAMIVDLERNDLGRIALPGSVRVESHARLETHAHVHHLVSDVVCRLREDVGALDMLKAVFPCGSITGAPKIASMNAIAELEGTTRGPYTGSLGAFGPRRLVKLNVAIRTAMARDGHLIFQAGGGIVIDSDPSAEYDETIHKARGLYLAWKGRRREL